MVSDDARVLRILDVSSCSKVFSRYLFFIVIYFHFMYIIKQLHLTYNCFCSTKCDNPLIQLYFQGSVLCLSSIRRVNPSANSPKTPERDIFTFSPLFSFMKLSSSGGTIQAFSPVFLPFAFPAISSAISESMPSGLFLPRSTIT